MQKGMERMANTYKEITTATKATDINEDDYVFINQYNALKQIKKSDLIKGETLNEKVDKETVRAILNKKPTVNSLSDFFALQATTDVYQTKVWNSAYNPTPTCEKLGANAGLVCEPSTDTTEGQDDYADKIEFMWWYCNYEYDANGNKIVTAIEGDANYSESGIVDVGVVGMTFYYKFDLSNSNYQLLSWSTSPNDSLNLVPYDYSVMHDGTIRPYYVISAFPSIKGTDGLLHSQPNGRMEVFQSHNNMITNYGKKGTNVTGARASRQTFQYIFNLIKYGTKNSQSIYAGVTNWNFQYSAAVQRTTKLTYFPVTASQAANLEVGCCVSVGYGVNSNGSVSNDRNNATIHKYADDVKILRIEDMDDGNKAVYLDIDTGFDTTPVALTDTLNAPIIMSSMHMWTGETKKVIGKHDGSAVSNTSGRHSYRVQGVEYALGAYFVASDVVMVFKRDHSKDVYVAPRGVKHSTSEATIKSTYKLIGNIPNSGNGADFWIGDITVDEETGAWFPSSIISSDSQGMCDRLYAGGAQTSGTREYLQGGHLGYGVHAGVSSLDCWSGLSSADWLCAAAD